ncbi:hypothetical protein D8779_10935 [Pseudomonas leptonychotis]|uniref:Uncharacterized protein n=1 Tax=Pseudomonas leptonychotis TaxID=2448482 RepID=A0A4T1ZYN6_9PSED|nr:hypothetical protein D8779_10935 [Pseudomonas leptonychotis]
MAHSLQKEALDDFAHLDGALRGCLLQQARVHVMQACLAMWPVLQLTLLQRSSPAWLTGVLSTLAWVGIGRVSNARASRLLKSPAWRTWLRVVGIAIPLLLLLCLRRSRGSACCHGRDWRIEQFMFNWAIWLLSGMLFTKIMSTVTVIMITDLAS